MYALQSVNMEHPIMRCICTDLYFHLWQKCCHVSNTSMLLSKTVSQQPKEKMLSKAYNFDKALMLNATLMKDDWNVSSSRLPYVLIRRPASQPARSKERLLPPLTGSGACPKPFCVGWAGSSLLEMAWLLFTLRYKKIANLTLQWNSSAIYNSSSCIFEKSTREIS